MTRDPSPKKSETIEIRLDYETKSALQARARAEGRSVSEILRGLIARYLGAEVPSSTIERSVNIMKFSSIGMAFGAIVVAGAIWVSPAIAGDLSLGVTARVEQMNQAPTHTRPTPEARFDLSFGERAVLCVPRDRSAVVRADQSGGCPFDAAAGYALLVVWAEPAGENHVMIGSQLLPLNAAEAARGGLLGPQFPVAYGQSSEMLAHQGDLPDAVRVTLFASRPS